MEDSGCESSLSSGSGRSVTEMFSDGDEMCGSSIEGEWVWNRRFVRDARKRARFVKGRACIKADDDEGGGEEGVAPQKSRAMVEEVDKVCVEESAENDAEVESGAVDDVDVGGGVAMVEKAGDVSGAESAVGNSEVERAARRMGNSELPVRASVSVEVLMQGEVPHVDGSDVALEEGVESAMDDSEVDRGHVKGVDGGSEIARKGGEGGQGEEPHGHLLRERNPELLRALRGHGKGTHFD